MLGILLVAGSVLLGSWAVRSAGHTVAVYAVAQTLTAGDPVTAADLVAVEVRLGEDLGRYVPVTEVLPEDAVVLRTVGGRELLARSALGSTEDLADRLVAVPVSRALPSSVRVGSLVDLWAVAAADRSGATVALPAPVAEGLVVAELTERGGGLVASGAPTVQVLVPESRLAAVLAALAGDGEVVVLPVPGAAA